MIFAAVALLLIAGYFRSGPLFFAVGVVVVLAVGGDIWLRRVTRDLRIQRVLDVRLFYHESTTVTLSLANGSALPIPWLELDESLPPALILPSVLSRVLTIGPRQRVEISYKLMGRKRGVHTIGPLTVKMGDVFGLARRELQWHTRHTLIVYPRMLAASDLALPSSALFGDVRSRRPFLGDFARMAGVRPYQRGDPVHDIHWRATAATGAVQVKQYQPATTLQVGIFLDLDRTGYRRADAYATAEFAITIAATLANRLIEQRQEVGLVTNGRVTLLPEETGNTIPVSFLANGAAEMAGSAATSTSRQPALVLREQSQTAIPPPDPDTRGAAPIEPAKGQSHLMRILELLARVEVTEQGVPLDTLLQRGLALPWGSTAIVITGHIGDELMISLHRLRRSGLLVVVFVVEQPANRAELESRAHAAGISAHVVWRDDQFQAVAV